MIEKPTAKSNGDFTPEDILKAETEVIERYYIPCIGVDCKQHVCMIHKDICKCGVKVARKTILKNDYKRLSCYECTY